MSRMKLRSWLLTLVIIPCLVTVVIAFESAWSRRASGREAESLGRLCRLAVVIGDLLHQTQRERGTSSVFLSSNGAKFADRLQEQRKATDEARLRFFELVESQRAEWPAHVVATLELAVSSLRDIEGRRRQISAFEISAGDEIAYFTGLNDRLLDSLGVLVSNTADVDLQELATSYLYFLHAKEKTGLERAQGANAFGTGHFGQGQLATVAGLVATEEAYLKVFLQLAPEDIAEAYRVRMAAPFIADVKQMETILFGRNGDFGVDSAVWYATMTKKIDCYKEIEDLLSQRVEQRSSQLVDRARGSLWGALGLALLFLSAAAFTTLAMCRSIVFPIERLTKALEEWASLRGWEPWQVKGPKEVRSLCEAFARLVHVVEARASGTSARALAARPRSVAAP